MRTDPALRIAPGRGAAGGGNGAALHAPVLDLGQPARDRLARCRRWMAFARFRRSLYLRGETREIVCLCCHSIDPGPLNIRIALPEVIDWRRLDFGTDATAEVDGGSLSLGGRIRFHLGRARIWKPAFVDELRDPTSTRLRALLEAAAVRAPDAGLGAVFRAPRSRPATNRRSASDGVLAAAAPAMAALERWLTDACARQEAQAHSPPPHAIDLVGLGPGLTPSGDDYLGGLMVGLRAINRSDLAVGLARLILPVARRQTGAISRAHLSCAAEGQVCAALHRTLAAIAGTGPFDTGSCLAAVARMGATSGWDALAGAVMPFRIHLGIYLPAPEPGR